jgi:hypothetical protein
MQDNLRNIWSGFRLGMQALLLMGHLCACHIPVGVQTPPAQEVAQK